MIWKLLQKNLVKQMFKSFFFDFIQNDDKLLIVIKQDNYYDDNQEINNVNNTPIIIVWDLFNASDNCVRKINDTFSLFPKNSEFHQRLANSLGHLITITEDGNIIPLLNESEIIKLLNPINDNTRNPIQFNNKSSSSSNTTITNYHSIYNSSGKFLDSKTENRIIKNPEPWLQNKNYERTSVYLDVNRSIQLSIGESTVQVWRKRKCGTSSKVSLSSSSTRVLEYIWTNNFNRPMKIQS